MVEKWFDEANDPGANDAAGALSEETWRGIKELGLMGLQVPEHLGGLGLSNAGYARLGEVMGRDLGLSIAVGAHQSIGFKGILLFGTPEQKERWLPKLSSGEYIAAFALTEPSTGSDAKAVKSTAKLDPATGEWVLNGSKIWISNGGIADVFTVFAATPETASPDHPTKNHMTAFVVERTMPGVTSGPAEKKMGIKASNTAEVYFEDVRIPAANVLTEPGNGFKVAMEILNNGRFGMGGALSGTMKECIAKAAEHAKNRTQFDDKISNYPVVQEKLGRMAARLYATESMAYTISANMDMGSEDYQLEAAIGKIFASESAWEVADETVQIYGGMGFMTDAGVERIVRDLRIFRIFEGTNEILRLFVALTGIQSAVPTAKALSPADKVGYAVRKFLPSYGVPTFPNLDAVPAELHDMANNVVAAGSRSFGDAVLTVMQRYKKDVIKEQLVCSRLADAAIWHYAAACSLSRASKAVADGIETASKEVTLAQVVGNMAKERMDLALAAVNAEATAAKDAKVLQAAQDVLEADGHATTHPLRV